MKKFIFLSTVLLLMTFSYKVNSQILYENGFNYSATLTQLEQAGTKYYLMDVPDEQCRLYNPDFSLWKTANFNIPNGQWLTGIQNVTQHLFNTDDLVEFLIIYYDYIETNNSYYYIYTTEVVNENGYVLLSIPGGSYAEVKSLTPDESKLFVYVYDYSTFPYSVETRIYGIPGMQTGIVEPEIWPYSEGKSKAESIIYPNPSDGTLKLRMKALPYPESAWLMVRDTNGSLVRSLQINTGFSDQALPDMSLNNGVYFYNIESQNYHSKPKKLVILK